MKEINTRFFSTAAFFTLLLLFLSPALSAGVKIFPPHWWNGMENKQLELIIYDTAGFEQVPEILEGAKLISAKAAANPAYYYLLMELPDIEEESTISIKYGNTEINYLLKQREKHTLEGLDPSDVMYLITPDRFANGDKSNDIAEGLKEEKYGREHPYGRHGGDIQGIINNLDYIDNLGFNTLWISPLLTNDQPHESYHGYAITDHYSIDPRFGSNALYGKLIEEMKSRNMKMVMDVIYNHVGTEHLFFRDLPDSSFFNFHASAEDGFVQTNYRAITLMDPHASQKDKNTFTDGWFVRHMPDLNQRNEQVARYLIQNSIWWIEEYGIDSYRIDTYTYPDQQFMSDLALAIKKEYPNFFLFGETWVHFPEIQSYFVEGNRYNPINTYLDGVTDFQFYYGAQEALNQQQGWSEGVAKFYYKMASDYLYKHPEKNVTFLDNHDLARAYGVFGEDIQKMKSALTLLFTIRGIPCMYYGTEILMKKTDNHGEIREDFPGGWEDDKVNKFTAEGRSAQENEMYNFIKDLLEWRVTSEAVTEGQMVHFVPQKGVYIYFRYSENDTVMVLLNTNSGEERRVDLSRFSELWPEGSKAFNVIRKEEFSGSKILLPAQSVQILQLH